MKNKNRKGFTLIELLIVIAIIAVLSVVVILSLNPAELLRQARDSNRISDMATMKSAVSLYLADVASPYLGVAATCYISVATSAGNPLLDMVNSAGTWSTSTTCGGNNLFASTTATSTILATSTRTIGVVTTTTSAPGNGWVPVDFANISSGSPIGQEPVDPINQAGTCLGTNANVSLSSCGLYYGYAISGTNFKLTTVMESLKYTKGGGGDVETSDGGNNAYVYEGGTSPTL
jgi:prepilin-type N-terminal cleavage/methylation domain-containing protein